MHPTSSRTAAPRIAASRPVASRRGVTLVELTGVMIVLVAISFTAIPAMTGVERAAGAGDRDAVETMVVLARQRAWTTGRPHAIRVDGDELSLVWIPSDGDAPTWVVSSFGDDAQDERVLASDGVTQVTVVDPAGGGTAELWFGAGGEALEREPDDAAGQAVSEAVEIRFESGRTLRIEPRSGMLRW